MHIGSLTFSVLRPQELHNFYTRQLNVVRVFTAAGRRGQQTFGLRADCLFHVSHLHSREGLIKSGSPSLADEFFIKTICSPRAPTKICKSSINWSLMISMIWSFTAKSSLCTVHWRLSRAVVHMEKQWKNIHQRVTKGSQTLHGDLDVQRSSLRLWAMQGPLESENEICCLTSLYWNPHFYQNVEDQGQTESRSGGTWASDEHNPREFLSVRPNQTLWYPCWYNKIHGLCVCVCVCAQCLSRVMLGFRCWI